MPVWDTLPVLPWIDRVCLLTHQLSTEATDEIPLKHLFEGGAYIREMRLPQGTFMTGREHLQGHEMQLLEGSVLLVAPDGRFQFDAPARLTSRRGFHAVCVALEDSLVRSVHPNPEGLTDVEVLENAWFGGLEPMLERGRAIAKAVGLLS